MQEMRVSGNAFVVLARRLDRRAGVRLSVRHAPGKEETGEKPEESFAVWDCGPPNDQDSATSLYVSNHFLPHFSVRPTNSIPFFSYNYVADEPFGYAIEEYLREGALP
jgi:hypothetical protein